MPYQIGHTTKIENGNVMVEALFHLRNSRKSGHASEKLEIIRTVEASHLPVKQTLAMIGIPSSMYFDWYARWCDGGVDALADRSPRPKSVWNRIPDKVREDVVDFALEHEDLTPRELAVKYTDEKLTGIPFHLSSMELWLPWLHFLSGCNNGISLRLYGRLLIDKWN